MNKKDELTIVHADEQGDWIEPTLEKVDEGQHIIVEYEGKCFRLELMEGEGIY